MARSCAYCAQDYTPSTSAMCYCSPLCRSRGKYAAKKADGRYARQLERKRELYQPRPPRPAKPLRLCNIDGCERKHEAHGLCKMHVRRGNRKPEPWTDRDRDKYHRRRARNPMSRSIDHIIPISKGGQHTLANTRLLHLRCNSQRGNRTETTRPDRAHDEA